MKTTFVKSFVKKIKTKDTHRQKMSLMDDKSVHKFNDENENVKNKIDESVRENDMVKQPPGPVHEV